MLWYACDRLRELRGIDKPIRVLLGELFRLKDCNVKMEADLFLTRDPCDPCLLIKQLIEDYTGIKFNIRPLQNLGELQAAKNAQGWMTFGRYAEGNQDDEAEEEDQSFEIVEEEVIERTKSTFEIVIRAKSATPEKSKPKSRSQMPTPPSSQSSTITRKSSVSHIRSFLHQPAFYLPAASQQEEQEDDEDYYEPPTRSRKTKKTTASTKTSNQGSKRNIAVSNEDVFGAEARRKTKLLLRERAKKRRA